MNYETPERDAIRRNLTQTAIAQPLLGEIQKYQDKLAGDPAWKDATQYDLIIDPNLDYAEGREKACEKIAGLVRQISSSARPRYETAHPYVFVKLAAAEILELIRLDYIEQSGARTGDAISQGSGKQRLSRPSRAIYRIWEDPEILPLITNSVSTVKADAARVAFKADGRNIVWAVVDSGIDGKHPHFTQYENLRDLPLPVAHADFTSLDGAGAPLSDSFGHGTHVAGIIAGFIPQASSPSAVIRTRDDETGAVSAAIRPLNQDASGMAPRCKLLSLKVLDDRGRGNVSSVIEAIAYVQKLNDFGRRIIVHGMNLSVGYIFKPEWFACGQSPLCVEVDRLVRSGVSVVVAAGNSGYGSIAASFGGIAAAGLSLTINDPGNAALAITVGSTHRDMPHTYGVSYFSSKGPTGDGRLKPDLVAPGERILSCAAGATKDDAAAGLPDAERGNTFEYVEDTGTSMAAPHVSGAVAAFLSVRREFIGQPEQVKKLFMDSAIDLNRDRNFQGSGLLDLMRAIQSV